MAGSGAPAAFSIIDALRAITGPQGLLTGDDVRARSCDPLRNVPNRAAAIVRPARTDELSRILRLCAKHNQPVVTQGGCTGVAGGAYAREGDIVVSLERMTRIEDICPVSQTAVVQAGVTVEALQAAAAANGMFYPVDLGSKGTATIGGTIATNAGGNRVIRWGMTRQNVLGVEAVLADGMVMSSLNRLIKNNTGYSLKDLFVGSEGTLGIVSRAVVKLVPAPTTQSVAILSVGSFEKVVALLARARQVPTLSAFEVMWRDFYDLMANSGTNRCPLALGQPFYVLVETLGYHESVDGQLFEAFLERAYEDGLVTDAVRAASGKQCEDLWRVREGSEVIVRAMSPFLSFDISVEISALERYVEKTYAALRRAHGDVRTVTFGHLGDNNIHIGVMIGPDTLDAKSRIEETVYETLREFGGSISAEHGIGQHKRELLAQHKSAEEIETMRRIKAALDPVGVLNPQVIFRSPAGPASPGPLRF